MRHPERLLLLCGVVSAALTALAGAADGSRTAWLLVPWLAAHATYAVAAWLVLRKGARPRLAWIIAVGILPRLVLLPSAPRLSEDAYRYLWDGRLVAEGVNPFRYAPTDPSLARYHDALLARLNHADVPTIYPPMAQLLFGAVAGTAVEPWAWKGALLLLEAVLVLSLLALLRGRGSPREHLLLYWWCPLPIIESFGSGHVDLAAAAFLLFALALIERRHAAWGGAAFAAAVLVKYMPLLLVPTLVRRRAFTALAAGVLAAAVLFLPFYAAGTALWTGLTTYVRHWEFNGSAYALIRPLFASGIAPRVILAGLLAVACLVVGWRARTATGAALALFAVWLVASPTVYPWYLVPLVALLPLHPNAGILAFSGLVALSYVPLAAFRADGTWMLASWIPWVEYGGWIAVAAGAAWSRYRRTEAWATERTPT